MLPQTVYKILYYSLIYPYLSYCNIVWASTFPTILLKILVLQKRFVRIATRSVSYASSAPLFQRLQIFTIYDINMFQTCVFTYKILFSEGNIPEQFTTYFTANSQLHSHLTRTSSALHLPKFRTCRGQFSIRFRGAKLWNDFFHQTKTCISINCYKKCLKKYLTAAL